ncbi:MAG: sulfite exporter TauE/SafE family protein [Phycisphaerae bacterium]|nr:sulfite exporter TauE/SafE family protein [Phycisphaerae bacterium]
MDYITLSAIGLTMGFFGGLLGIGGSAIMIPAMVFSFGENQHLYQASAMICNFVVGVSSTLAHHKANALHKPVLKTMVPLALVGIVAGVAWSNSAMFSAGNSYVLARVFGGFLVYVALYNGYKLYCSLRHEPEVDVSGHAIVSTPWVSGLVGLVTGLSAGLLGIGAGTVATPIQQLVLKMPMRRAMSNSAVTIMSIAWLGALYKNATLGKHGIAFEMFPEDNPVWISIKIAAIVAPTAFLGGFLGAHMMHKLPRNVVRMVFIVIVVLAAIRLLTVKS